MQSTIILILAVTDMVIPPFLIIDIIRTLILGSLAHIENVL